MSRRAILMGVAALSVLVAASIYRAHSQSQDELVEEAEQVNPPALRDFASADPVSQYEPGELQSFATTAAEDDGTDDPADQVIVGSLPTSSYDVPVADRPAREFNEDAAKYDARREMARRGYRGFCYSDCSGHEAGYQWAYENRLSRPAYTSDSPSFDEGQEAFVRDVRRRVEEKRMEFDNDPETSEYAE